jgi:hypothetical protein
MNTEVLTYSRSKGVFAGLTLEGAVVEQDNDSTHAIYGKNMMFRNILSGKATTPRSADAFLKAVSEAGQQAKIAGPAGTAYRFRRLGFVMIRLLFSMWSPLREGTKCTAFGNNRACWSIAA